MPGDSTFGDLWKKILLYCPDLPLPLAQEFVNTAYSRALTSIDWTGLKGYGSIILPAQYNTGTATVVQESTTVTGVATAWTSAMVGRQFYMNGRAPFYTITAVDTGAQTLTLDRVWGEAGTTAAYTIQLIYVVMPDDFLNFTSIVDLVNRWQIWKDVPQEWLDRVDAARIYAGSPSWVVSYASPSPVTATLNQVRYEIWPRGGGDKTYPYTYIKKPPLLSASTDRIMFPIRGDLVREGALAELALWPGTGEIKNPYYDLQNHREHEKRFQERLELVLNEDQNIRQSRVWFEEERKGWPMAPIDSNFIQSHLVPTGGY